MRKLPVFLAAGLVLATTGCSTTKDRLNVAGDGSMKAEAMSIVSRPLEYGVTELGDSNGTASKTTILGFITLGDADEFSLPILGAGTKSGLEGAAAYRAATAKGGDAFFQVSSRTESSGIPGIYSKKTISVTGKALKLNHMGQLTAERADRIRGADQKKP